MSMKWTDREIGLLEVLRPVCDTREIQEILTTLGHKRSLEAIAKKSRLCGISFREHGHPVSNNLSREEVAVIQQTVSKRENTLCAISMPTPLSPSQKSKATSQRRTFMSKIAEELQTLREETARTCSVSLRRAESKEKESLVVMISDCHMGRIIRDDANREIYNMDIAAERIMSTPERVCKALSSEQMENVDELVILLLGDHIDGEGIFPAQEMSLEDHATEQVIRATRAIWYMIQGFKARFPLVRVVTTRGNHGAATSPESNWDNILFLQLELLIDMTADPHLTIKNRYGEYNTLEVKGWKGLVRHYAPVQADTAGGIKKFAGWYGIHNWDFFSFGHWHHWGVMTWNSKPIFRNGSLMGPDDYAEHLAVHDDPVQLVFGVTEEAIPSSIHPIRYGE
jgi:hypothetical protein